MSSIFSLVFYYIKMSEFILLLNNLKFGLLYGFMRFRVLNDKPVEIISNQRMIELFGETSSYVKGLDGVLYVNSSEYKMKKAQMVRIEPKEKLTPKRIVEDIYRDMLKVQRHCHTLWDELLIRNMED